MVLRAPRKEVWKYDLFYFSHKLFPLKEEPYNVYLANICCLLLKNSSVTVGTERVRFQEEKDFNLDSKRVAWHWLPERSFCVFFIN